MIDQSTAMQIMAWVGFILGALFGFMLCLLLVYEGVIKP
jgi:hypothetical protein